MIWYVKTYYYWSAWCWWGWICLVNMWWKSWSQSLQMTLLFFFFCMKKIQGKPETEKSYNKERKTTAGRAKQQQLRAAILQDNMLHKAWTHTFPNLWNTWNSSCSCRWLCWGKVNYRWWSEVINSRSSSADLVNWIWAMSICYQVLFYIHFIPLTKTQ